MTFITKYLAITAALVTIINGSPKPVEENSPPDENRNIIINIDVHCHFHFHSPECSDYRAEKSNAREKETDDFHGDERSSSGEEADSPENQSTADRYKLMEDYGILWTRRLLMRDNACSVCAAMMTRQNFIEDLDMAVLKGSLRNTELNIFESVLGNTEEIKTQIGLRGDEQVPGHMETSFCSAATRKLLRERAVVARKKKRRAVEKRAMDAADQLTFYNLFLDNLDADSNFLGCADYDSSHLSDIQWAIENAYVARQKWSRKYIQIDET